MRIQLLNKGNRVAFLSGGMIKKLTKEDEEDPSNNIYEDDIEATMAAAKKRAPNVEFDSVALVDEAVEAERQAKTLADAEAEAFVESDESKQQIVEQNQNAAFARFVNSFTIKGDYPQKQAAMKKAVDSLPETATANELFDAAVAALSA